MSTRVLETVTRYLDKPQCRTAEQMTAICCKTAEAVQCCEKVEVWDGYSDEELIKKLNLNLDAEGRDEQGRYVEIRRIPRSKPCGEKVTRYDVRPRGCCDEAPPMGWDTAATPEVLPAGATIWIYATGGIPPFTFSVTSHGLYFDDGRRSWTTDARFARLHAGETFCGTGLVQVTDGCSTAALELRSDLGVWVYLGAKCALPGVDVVAADGSDGRWVSGTNTLIFGKYKQVEEHQPILVQILEIPPPCGEANTQECYECIGNTFTCPKGAIIRATHPANESPVCLGYPMNALTVPGISGQLQAFCGDGATASYGGYFSVDWGSCGLGVISTYGWIYQVSIALYQWRCG